MIIISHFSTHRLTFREIEEELEQKFNQRNSVDPIKQRSYCKLWARSSTRHQEKLKQDGLRNISGSLRDICSNYTRCLVVVNQGPSIAINQNMFEPLQRGLKIFWETLLMFLWSLLVMCFGGFTGMAMAGASSSFSGHCNRRVGIIISFIAAYFRSIARRSIFRSSVRWWSNYKLARVDKWFAKHFRH